MFVQWRHLPIISFSLRRAIQARFHGPESRRLHFAPNPSYERALGS